MCLDPRKPESRVVLGEARRLARQAQEKAATAHLIRRLREWGQYWITDSGTAALMTEAADALERLDAGRATPPA